MTQGKANEGNSDIVTKIPSSKNHAYLRQDWNNKRKQNIRNNISPCWSCRTRIKTWTLWSLKFSYQTLGRQHTLMNSYSKLVSLTSAWHSQSTMNLWSLEQLSKYEPGQASLLNGAEPHQHATLQSENPLGFCYLLPWL